MISESNWVVFVRDSRLPEEMLFKILSFTGPLVVDIPAVPSWTTEERNNSKALCLMRKWWIQRKEMKLFMTWAMMCLTILSV
jgi:hypothetical protein